MAYWSFCEAILSGEPIRLFNGGRMKRDFTFIDDIVEAMIRMTEGPAVGGHEIFNIGNSNPVELSRFVAAIEAACGRKAIVETAPMQPGDVGHTFADVSKLEARYGYRPSVSIEDGIKRFVDWYRPWRET
jgi:UDP-glucuronate 4-epimerase